MLQNTMIQIFYGMVSVLPVCEQSFDGERSTFDQRSRGGDHVSFVYRIYGTRRDLITTITWSFARNLRRQELVILVCYLLS